MTVSAGIIVYHLGSLPCLGVGVRWTEEETVAAMDGGVSEVLFDDEKKVNIKEIFAGLADTDFDQIRLHRILDKVNKFKIWRVGEAIAETYLTNHRSCNFPWPIGRDERKSGSSLPGTDLVESGIDIDGDCFAYGEVKTSNDSYYPPRVNYGSKGLKRQLDDLRDREAVRYKLFIYFSHRANAASWRACFQHAARRYLQNRSDVQLYGFIVRDVEPHQDDLKVRVSKVAIGCPQGTYIELLALYLPHNRMNGIGKAIIKRQAGKANG